MLTRCPECGTTFRVSPEQLKMRSGRVRCGACRRVFDALETLAEEAAAAKEERIAASSTAASTGRDAAAEEAARPFAAAVEQVPDGAVGAELAQEPSEGMQAEEIDADIAGAGVQTAGAGPSQVLGAERAGSDALSAHAEIEKAHASTDASAVAEQAIPAETTAPEQAAGETPVASEPPRTAEKKRRRPRTWPWALGAGAGVLALAVQALLHFRTELAVLYPETRPLLVSACETLGCKLWRPRKPELVGIEASDLSVADGSLALTATLRNRAPFAQEYPHLELTLTDTADRALVRRVLAPTEYLPPQTPVAAGFGARTEAVVNLAILTRDVAAAGYRLYLFYP